MDRRESLKALLIGTIGGTALVANSCVDKEQEAVEAAVEKYYGRNTSELQRDKKIESEVYLNAHELSTIAILCDIILPKSQHAGSAVDAGVPDFIDFIVKDIPSHQLPIRGGIMWIDNEANSRFGGEFSQIDQVQQMEIVEDIAYPDRKTNDPRLSQGVKFFDLMRKLTLTGYYTSKMGFEDLGYAGNRPNIWDGVPDDILKKHGLAYDPEWLAKCVNQDQRNEIAKWDENMNLIS